MALDLSTCQKRVTALLGANAKNADGSMIYSTVVADDRRHATEISDEVTEAALAVLHAIARSTRSGFRGALVAEVDVNHGARIPDHIGPIGVVKIQRFDGDTFRKGERRPAAEIESLRENRHNLYAEVAHDQQDDEGNPSPISGFYDDLNDELFYTGSLAHVPIATVARADAANKVPEVCEDVVVALAFALAVKDGDISLTSLGSHYGSYATAQLGALEAGAMTIEPLEQKAA